MNKSVEILRCAFCNTKLVSYEEHGCGHLFFIRRRYLSDEVNASPTLAIYSESPIWAIMEYMEFTNSNQTNGLFYFEVGSEFNTHVFNVTIDKISGEITCNQSLFLPEPHPYFKKTRIRYAEEFTQNVVRSMKAKGEKLTEELEKNINLFIRGIPF